MPCCEAVPLALVVNYEEPFGRTSASVFPHRLSRTFQLPLIQLLMRLLHFINNIHYPTHVAVHDVVYYHDIYNAWFVEPGRESLCLFINQKLALPNLIV